MRISKIINNKFIKSYLSYFYHFCLLYSGKYRNNVKYITFEISNICNLKCPMCDNSHLKRKKSLMTLEDFKRIVVKLPKNIKLFNFTGIGEPLLNKEIFSMIRCYRDSNSSAHIRISTNGTNLHVFNSEEILRSGVDQIDIAIDGATAQTHETYRVGSDFQALCDNVKKLCAEKKRLNLDSPKIVQMTLLTKENAAELDKIKNLARSVGVDELHLRYMNIPGLGKKTTDFDGQRNEWINKYVTTEPYSRYKEKNGAYAIVQEKRHCGSFLAPFIYCNGDVSVCCNDDGGKHTFGNLLKDDFETVMSGIPAKAIFKKKLSICGNCIISRLGANFAELKEF